MVVAFVLSQLAALPDALLALWLMLLGKGVLEHRPGMVKGAAIGWVSRPPRRVSPHRQTRVQRRFPRQSDHRAGVARSRNCKPPSPPLRIRTPGVSRSPVHAPQSGFVLDHMYMSVFSSWGGSCGWA